MQEAPDSKVVDGVLYERDSSTGQWNAVTPASDKTDLLSVTEAKALGVTYGTSVQDALSMNIIPKTGTTEDLTYKQRVDL